MKAFSSTILLLFAAGASGLNAQEKGDPKLATAAIALLEKYCYRCHGQNGAKEGSLDYVLSPAKLAEAGKIVRGDAAASRMFKRIIKGSMPPDEDGIPRPLDEEIELLKRWINAGAPEAVVVVEKARPFITTKSMLLAVRDHLESTDRNDRPYQRYFTLTHLHNLRKVKNQDLPLYRAALAKLVNSLSWKSRIVTPRAVDKEQTIFAIDLRDADWDRENLWQEILKRYPYGLKHDRYPDDDETREIARGLYELSGTELPMIRADWFIATASRPPLYHSLLRIPESAVDLERDLKVDVIANFQRDRLWRAGFTSSGISGQNRLVERHEAAFGSYWKSYDFKTNQGRGNLFQFPLGPVFKEHPHPDLAFKHDGGEIIFNLPNGMQGYMLIDSNDRRIDEGPIDVVSDRLKTSGTPAIVNGLSCMACHTTGMIRFKDTVAANSAAAGAALEKLRALFPRQAEMDKLIDEDEARFLLALDKATGAFLRSGPNDKTDITSFPETIGPIARWYRMQELGADEIAAELGMRDSKPLKEAIQANRLLKNLGLGPLAANETIKREAWESTHFFISPYQETSRILELGSPKRLH